MRCTLSPQKMLYFLPILCPSCDKTFRKLSSVPLLPHFYPHGCFYFSNTSQMFKFWWNHFTILASPPVPLLKHPLYPGLANVQLPTSLRSHWVERSRQTEIELGEKGGQCLGHDGSRTFLLSAFLRKRPACKFPSFHFRLFCFTNACHMLIPTLYAGVTAMDNAGVSPSRNFIRKGNH